MELSHMLEAEEHRNQHLEKRVKHYQQEIQKLHALMRNRESAQDLLNKIERLEAELVSERSKNRSGGQVGIDAEVKKEKDRADALQAELDGAQKRAAELEEEVFKLSEENAQGEESASRLAAAEEEGRKAAEHRLKEALSAKEAAEERARSVETRASERERESAGSHRAPPPPAGCALRGTPLSPSPFPKVDLQAVRVVRQRGLCGERWRPLSD